MAHKALDKRAQLSYYYLKSLKHRGYNDNKN